MCLRHSDKWSILCKKELCANYTKFIPGNTYGVKDKFTGPDGSLDTGIWEVKDGHGGLVNIDRETRDNHFICHYDTREE